MAKLLLEYDPDTLPAGVNDQYHPTSDQYLRSIHRVQKAIVQQSSKLTPTQVKIAKLHHRGEKNVAIAREIERSPVTVSKALALGAVQTLIALLQHYQIAVDGPQEAVRRAMLWRIATDNEVPAPKTAIAAVVELNRMAGVGQANAAPAQTTIIINQDAMPRTTLDG